MTSIDIAAIDRIITEVAATEIMPRFRQLVDGDIEMKGVDDPVTVADKAAERVLTARLMACLPGSTVVGEEGFAADKSIAARLGGDLPVWIIDPIDGTRNFISGKTEFGTMVALRQGAETLASWIHDPVSGDMLAAERGGGTWLRRDGQTHKMKIAAHDRAQPRLGIIGTRLNRALAAAKAGLPDFLPGSAAAFDYGRLFTGDAVFAGNAASRAAFLLYRQSKPWDHVPGLLMVDEAGGYAADLYGNPYDPRRDKDGLFVAPDRESWQTYYRTMKPVIDILISR